MNSWMDMPRLGFDTETTARNPRQARLVTASVVLAGADGTLEKAYWLADPGIPIPEETTKIHGITTEQARAEGRHVAEVLDEVASILAAHLAQGYPVVAYNAGYDLTLLECELARHVLPTVAERLGHEVFPVIDPYYLDRWADRFRKGPRKLINLVAHYGVESTEGFHNAEEDVLATLRVLDAMIDWDYSGKSLPQFTGGRTSLKECSLEELVEGARDSHANMVDYFNRKAKEEGREGRESHAWPIYD